jgi:hypothetical protein
LKYWANGFDPEFIVYWDVRDELITVIGDVALVRSTNKCTRRRDGNEVTGMTTYTDTYLFENGAWKCIQAQITAVAPEHYPADDTIVSVYIKGVLATASGMNAFIMRRLAARQDMCRHGALQTLRGWTADGRAANLRFPPRGSSCSSFITPPAPARWLRTSLWKRPGASYTAERLDFKNSQQTTPQYLAINPKGRVPALVTDSRPSDRDAGDPRLHRAELSEGQADAGRAVCLRASAVLQQLSLLDGSISTHAHTDARLSLGGRRTSFSDMKRKVAGNHGRQLRLARARDAERAVGHGRAVHDLRSLSLTPSPGWLEATRRSRDVAEGGRLTASGWKNGRRAEGAGRREAA